MGAPAVSVRPRPRRTAAPAKRVSDPSARSTARAAAGSTARGAAGKRAASARTRPATTTRRRSRITPPGGVAMLPVAAVGGAAGAVGDIADSGVVVGMTRSRVWIGVIGLLLGGIVAVNVWGLSLSASTSGMADRIDELERANSVQRSRIAKRSSSERVQAVAKASGLATPAPRAVEYLKARPRDAATAAGRLAAGEISVLALLPIAPELGAAAAVPPAEGALDPAAPVAPVDPAPAVGDPAAVAPDPGTVSPAPAVAPPADPAPAPAAPATTTPPAAAGGGVTP